MEKIYRELSSDEIAMLQSQGCQAQQWEQVMVSEGIDLSQVVNVAFSGYVRLGSLGGYFELPGGLCRPSGVRNATLHNVEVGDNCLIENIRGYIANYRIGHDTRISNIGILAVDGHCSFGNSIDISVLNETGGREVMMHDCLSAHQAYFMALYRHRPQLIQNMRKIIGRYAKRHCG